MKIKEIVCGLHSTGLENGPLTDPYEPLVRNSMHWSREVRDRSSSNNLHIKELTGDQIYLGR
jgi:hypothetical protein